jgi:hypothetical protein
MIDHDHEWECVFDGNRADTYRCRVPGGWLYRHGTYSEDMEPIAIAMVFVPDQRD